LGLIDRSCITKEKAEDNIKKRPLGKLLKYRTCLTAPKDCRYTPGVPKLGPQTVEETNTQTSDGDRSPDIQLKQLTVVIPTDLLLIVH
jgi:hypothetical protein